MKSQIEKSVEHEMDITKISWFIGCRIIRGKCAYGPPQ